MADDLQHRLDEARTQFAAKQYDAALKTLSTCPQDDAKVIHNTVICQYAARPTNYRGVLVKLDLPAIQRVKSLKTGQLTPTVVLQYEGQESAFINVAVMLLHNGALLEARNVLLALANVSSNFTPAVRVRIAMLLHIATRRWPNNDASEITGNLLSDSATAQQDPVLKKMMEIAFSDTASLHSLFAQVPKSQQDRALYLNNLGVEAFADGKAAVAGVFFARASQACTDGACPFVANSIAYNSAICALSRGVEGSGAVNALLAAQTTMSGSPMLWIRLAQSLLDRFHEAARNADNATFDAEIHERVQALHQGNAFGFPAIPPQLVTVPSGAAPLINATAQALQNALCLLVERNERLAEAAKRLALVHETALLLDAVLCMLAYVELTRGNHGAVIAIATEYATIERDVRHATLPRTQAVMACYHVEALCSANRNSQALRVLQNMNLGNLVSNKAPNAAIEALMLNVCVAYIMNGQWTKAIQLSQQLVAKLQGPVAQLLLAYIDLAQGNRASAAETISTLPQRAITQR
jgi:hypothetical protein